MKFAWIPDGQDTNDYLYSSLVDKQEHKKPAVDMRPYMTTVEDQRDIGSCVANALVGAIEYLYVYKILCRWTCLKPRDYSRLFVYWYARYLDNTHFYDNGCRIRTAIKALKQYGVCKEKDWPYSKSWHQEPSGSALEKAKQYKVEDYYRVTELKHILCALDNDLPVTFGCNIYESFISEEVAKTGIVSMPKGGERSHGGHAMLAVGFDQERQVVIVRNSWGSKWGMSGYCEIPMMYFDPWGEYVTDAWVIRNHPGQVIQGD